MNIAYVAGLIDGEGCINFCKCRDSVYPRLFITNTNQEILELLQEKYGGDINPLSLRKENWKQGYSWRVSWSKAVDLLEKVYPYLIIKRRQAQTVFAWDACRPNNEDREALQLLVDQMHWLNKKGNAVSVEPIILALK